MKPKAPPSRRSAGANRHTHAGLGWDLVKLVVGIVLFGLLVEFVAEGGNLVDEPAPRSVIVALERDTAEVLARCGPPATTHELPVVEMVYSPDIEPWVAWASAIFTRHCKNIRLSVTPLEDLAAIDRILSGELTPTVWAPTDALAVSYLQTRAEARDVPLEWLPEQATALVSSPLVWLLWEDRYRVLGPLLARGPIVDEAPRGLWARTLCPLLSRHPSREEAQGSRRIPPPGQSGRWSIAALEGTRRGLSRRTIEAPPTRCRRRRRSRPGARSGSATPSRADI